MTRFVYFFVMLYGNSVYPLGGVIDMYVSIQVSRLDIGGTFLIQQSDHMFSVILYHKIFTIQNNMKFPSYSIYKENFL